MTLTSNFETNRHAAFATAAMALAGLFVALVATLHAVQPDLTPSGHMLSEYALGRNGWLMTVAFYSLAASYLALFVALRSIVKGAGGYPGLGLLLIAAIGAAMGGLFPMDPVHTPSDQATQSGQLHGVGALLGIPGLILAVSFINGSLMRRPAWRGSRRLLLWTALAVWLTLLVFATSMTLLITGKVSVNLLIGWQNRLLMVSHIAWAVLLARHVRKNR